MLQLLTCSKGHSWEAAADDGAAVGRAVCPVCGEAVDLLPLFDLAPAPDAITTTPEPLLPQAPPLRDEAGKPVVAGYEIQDDLGRSPLGVRLFRAKQILVSRTVLLKVVVAREDAGQTGWGALRGEAASLGRLSHPNIVHILDAGERERQLFYNALEWVEGPTLAEHAAGEPMRPIHAARLVEALARAVHAAHEQDQVHRGLRLACIRLQPLPEGAESKRKPGGPVEPPFWLTDRGSRCLPRIAGFGLARRPVEGDAADMELYEDIPIGLAPEQAWGRAREIGPCSDIYALGAILYELIAGRPPFRGRTPGETLDFIRSGDPPTLLRQGPTPGIDLVSICGKAMQRHPRNRYKTARDMADDLRAFAARRPVKARPANVIDRSFLWVRRRPLAAMLVLVCMLAVAGALTAYLFGVGEAGASKAEVEAIRLRATAAENREASAQAELAESQKREQRSAYYHRIFLADRELRANNPKRARQLLDEDPPDLRHWEWHFLDEVVNRQMPGGAPMGFRSLTGAEQAVACTAFSPDGRKLAAAMGTDANWKVRVWDLASPDKSQELTGLGAPVHRIAFSPDGALLATASAPGNVGAVKEWNLAQRKVLRPLDIGTFGQPFDPATFGATDVAYSPDANRLLAVDSRGKLHVFLKGARNETAVNITTGGDWQDQDYRLAVLSSDGTRIAVVADRGTSVQIYDTQRNLKVGQAMQHQEQITALAFNAEANLLASASRDGAAKVWDLQKNQLVATLLGHVGPVTGVALTRDGKRLATVGEDSDIRIWDPATGQEILKLTPFDKDKPAGAAVTGVQFSPAKDAWQLAAARGTEVRIFGPPR
jgi:WD40 repeat protein